MPTTTTAQLMRTGAASATRAGESPASETASPWVERFATAWERGECHGVESFLAQWAPEGVEAEVAVRLIYEEMSLRREGGSAMTSEEVQRRFPQWAGELNVLLDCERLLAPAPTPRFPEAGDEVGAFRLLAELGRGAAGRVYLAVQPALSDRPVVVKLTPQTGREHLSLARLQHTGIVPLYLAQNLPDRNLRLLCMPYLGGVTFVQVVRRLASSATPKSGRDFAKAAEAADGDRAAMAHRGPALQFLHRATYGQAVGWIGACLADALHYAHQRGLAHFDVKPSNVLLAHDGQPMLLDFHLARSPLAAGEREPWLGGTPGYMAPEQQAAITALREGRPVPAAVDHRADIYALGMLLDELLRFVSFKGDARLRAIVRRCCAEAPHDRYPDASMLAGDLRRAMVERPGSASPWREALRRRSLPLPWLLAAALTVAIGSTALLSVRLRHAQTALAAATAKEQRRTQADRTQRLASSLQEVVNRLRWLTANERESGPAGRSLDAACHAIWEQRDRLLGVTRGGEASSSMRSDLLDLAFMWADLQVAAASPHEEDAALARAAAILAEAETALGPHPLLIFVRKTSSERLDAAAPADAAPLPQVHAGWEHVALARWLVRHGRLAEAHQTLRRGVAGAPHDFWLQYALGRSAVRAEQDDEALGAFSAAIALEPARPECREQRAAVYRRLGREELAALDESAAQALRNEP